MGYPFSEIEPKWQKFWEEREIFRTDPHSEKPPFYCLDMFPYPSGAGLHVGHPEGYTATDILCRLKRMQGFEVLHPMGWDAFGLPAERYAMTTGIHPKITTEKNIETFRNQIKMLGLSYDWSREISTTDPDYYRWTQWIFLQIYNSYFDPETQKAEPIGNLESYFAESGSGKYSTIALGNRSFTKENWISFTRREKEDILKEFRLVYEAQIPVNWCEGLGTVLANEEVEEWTSKGYTVERKPMRQYMMRITAYAERLLEDLTLCEWPPSTLEMQRNWIGKSEGLELVFPLPNHLEVEGVRVYTTRPDTLFGVSYLVLAPEHPLVIKITSPDKKTEVENYQKECALKSELERTELNKNKSGVFLGVYATSPVDRSKKIPIYISDYVLYGYGTGAIMAVPAHDQRDYEFAVKFRLPIYQVIAGDMKLGEAFDSKDSYCIHSKSDLVDINGLNYLEASQKISQWIESVGLGLKKKQFKLRDWLFARQRYWGEPIPIVHLDDGRPIALSERELPLLLPDLQEFKPSGTGESPLALATEWLQYSNNGQSGKRETNTMPQWAGSCWYYLRYIDPHNSNQLIDPILEKKWMPVQIYVGGSEHAVLHLLYSRFWHKILYDLGHVSSPEPFQKLVHQGLILGEDKSKMSKSRGNVVNPDEVVKEYGADTLRLFEMFMGPFEMTKPWSAKGVEGVYRFLNRVWRLFHSGPSDSFFVDEDLEASESELKILNRTIKKVHDDIVNFAFNTAISQMMIFVNEMTASERRPLSILKPFVLALSPFAPHLTEELWHKLGHATTLSFEPFPSWKEEYLRDETIPIAVQINGKLRGEFSAPRDIAEADAIDLAKKVEKALPFWNGKAIKKTIYVPGRLVNIVVD